MWEEDFFLTLALQSAIDIIALEEQVDKYTKLFHRLRASRETTTSVDEVQISNNKNQSGKSITNNKRIFLSLGCFSQ